MPRKAKKYLVHDLCDLTQTIKVGRKSLESYLRYDLSIPVDNNQLAMIAQPSPIDVLEPLFHSKSGHQIYAEELLDE